MTHISILFAISIHVQIYSGKLDISLFPMYVLVFAVLLGIIKAKESFDTKCSPCG